jgi:hypothetical protein
MGGSGGGGFRCKWIIWRIAMVWLWGWVGKFPSFAKSNILEDLVPLFLAEQGRLGIPLLS